MAHFIGQVQGNRGGASRTGSKNSGMIAHIRGWNVGARVHVSHEDGRDIVRVYKTGGSNAGFNRDELLAEFTAE